MSYRVLLKMGDVMKSKESLSLRFLYHTVVGRFCLKILVSRWVSFIVGKFLDSKWSKVIIPRFIKRNQIVMDDYDCDSFQCFNDCFTRKVKVDRRPIDLDKNHFISPCDGLISAYCIKKDLVIPVKQSQYSITSLLQDDELASRYQDGICLVFRLCVHHYHRYCYVDSGDKGKNVYIPGKLHTVRPIALESLPVFTENAREYTVMHTDHFGVVTQIEVGALLVGKIKNHHEEYHFVKGEEKGMFLYGGSTIVLLLEKGSVKIAEKIFEKTRLGEEYEVKMGERISE